MEICLFEYEKFSIFLHILHVFRKFYFFFFLEYISEIKFFWVEKIEFK